MILAAYRWIGLVLPRWWPLFFLVDLMAEIPYLLLVYAGAPIEPQVLAPHDGFLAVAAVVYGLFRVIAFHPLWQPEYRKWLELTPWTLEKPLPKGPVHLVLQDVVVLGALVALQHDSMIGRQLVPVGFAIAYLTILTLSIAPMFPNVAYGLAFGLSAPVLLFRHPVAAVVACLLLYGAALLASRKVFSQFPWRSSDNWQQAIVRLGTKGTTADVSLGWPVDFFQADPAPSRIAVYDGTMLSLLTGWWMCVLFWNSRENELVYIPYVVVLVICILSRCFLYFKNYWPPISILGRIATGKLLIPGYDVALVAPLVATIILVTVPAVMTRLGIPILVPCAVAATVALLVTFNLGPTLEAWRLTGAHRIAPIHEKTIFLQQ